ncbi:MAG: hypothetical protein BGO23_06610 [Solirubrobacterales bacterium 67-14]|nr:MAG: hypothetical protein BGO23_06610 [Solirubrobacterales bacterium 67-14]
MLLTAMAGTSNAADRVVRLTLQPSASECTAWDQMDCSYLELRNGNAAAPDPEVGPAPTFLNMAILPGAVTVDAVISDDGDVTIPANSVRFPAFSTSTENGLVGTVTIRIQIGSGGNWTGTYDEETGAMDLDAPFGLTFRLNCDAVANTTCAGLFGPEGNMGTWQVLPKNVTTPLTTGSLTAPTPPVEYGPEWLGPDAENGTPFDENGLGTLINNNLEIKNVTPDDCIDPSSTACNNAFVAGLIAPSVNSAIGTVYDSTTPANDRDSVPGAIDMRLTFQMSEPPILTADPSAVEFDGMNGDGSQPLGTSSAAKTVTLDALDAGDIPVNAIYTDGGQDDDFLITNAKGCSPTIESGGSCAVRVRFNPSATGARASTLYASIVNPVTSESQVVQLATLSGTGGELPQGPTGPTGADGPQGPKGKNGALVAISSASAVKLSTKAKKIATISTRGGAVQVKAPKKATIKVKGKKYKVQIKSPKKIGKNSKGQIKVKGSKGAVKALRGRASASLKLKVKVTAGNHSQKQTLKVRLN